MLESTHVKNNPNDLRLHFEYDFEGLIAEVHRDEIAISRRGGAAAYARKMSGVFR
jgi:hypothetical protein